MISLTFLLVISQVVILVSKTHGECNQDINIQHGRVLFGGNHYIVYCDPGYELDNSNVVYCVGNGWERPPPSCYTENLGPPIYPSNPCDKNNGGCDQMCTPMSGRVFCSCHRGYYRGPDGKSCIDVDECSENNGGCHQLCVNYRGGHYCTCKEGYRLDGSLKNCTGCRRNAYWSAEKNGCVDCPPNSYTLSEGKTSVEDCFCRPGYGGNLAQNIPCLDDDECSVHNFGCSHTCVNTPGGAFCSCPIGFDVDKDNKTCIDINECSVKNGGCEGLCINTNGSFYCRCPPGFKPSNKNHYSCDDVDECSENNGGCHQLCVNYRGGHYCTCKEGYRLDGSLKNCTGCRRNAYWSTEKNECVDCPPNSSTLSEGKTSIEDCFCRPGYSGNPAQNISCLDVDECSLYNFGCSHTCVNTPGGAFCSCPIGFEVDKDNKTCIDIDECSVKNGGCEGMCMNTNGSFYCICFPGFKPSIKNHYSCDDVDECSENNGGCHQLCVNYRGGHYCTCWEGYRLDGSLKNCTGCMRNAYWSTEKNGCVDCPPNSSTSSEGKTSVEDCFCRPGYSGNPAQNLPCLDDDECSVHNFGCSHTCVNTPGGAFCSCPIGFEVDKDNKTCRDIDECSVKNGGCEGMCINTNGSFYCRCPPGFKPSNKNHYSCDDVDECSKNNGGCDQLCVNYRGGYYCTCREGYRLDGSLKNCTGSTDQPAPSDEDESAGPPPDTSDSPDLCQNATIDTVTRTQNGSTYVFKEEFYWKVLSSGIADGYPRKIADDWDGLEGNLDASLTWSNGKTFFFKGGRYWRFTNKEMDSGYPKLLDQGFEGIPDMLDAAVVWSGNGKTYFFKGNEFWRYDSKNDPPVSGRYPKPISYWYGLPADGIDAAFQWENNRTYFFKGDKYYRFNDIRIEVDSGDPPYPRSTAVWWFDCKAASHRTDPTD